MTWLDDYRMRLMFVGLVAAVVLGGGVNAKADFVWMQKADMPTPRWSHTSAVVNGKIYVIGGGTSEPGDVMLSVTEVYDPATNMWTRKADMPTARGWMSPSSSVLDGKIYVFGGWDGSKTISTVEEYDPVTDVWIRKANMPTQRCTLATIALDGKIYAIGGEHPELVGSRTVEEYGPTTDTWTRKADMPAGLWGLCANAVNGRIYVLGGRPGLTAIPNMYEYDPTTDTWTRKADMPVATSQMGSVVLGGKIFVIGGWHWSADHPYTTVQMYDPEADVWTIQADTPFLRSCFSASVVNNRIYAIGGTDRPHPCPATSTVYKFGPLFDFNWDGIVDSTDMCILIDNWQTESPLYDIAPLPFGDGIVDVQDLIALAEHLFEEIIPVELIGHWRLDEAEGDVTYNSTSDNHGILSGNPAWQPDSGQVAGALEFDGIDDYIETDRVLNPADGVFSVLAWIKGGLPGQVVISQTDDAFSGGGKTWLGMDPSDGKVMTGLVPPPGRSKPMPLESEYIITDGQWHHVGFVWDGSYRHLYVDGVEVAEDATPLVGLEDAYGGLYFGVGSTLAPGTFWSGLIDDIRIYNRVVSP